MLEIGSLIDGKYKVLNEIGHGGMSIVYLAIVERANQTWAIKEVRKNGQTKNDIVEQGLVAEMNILKRLNHSHLPRIIDIIDYQDSFLIVMDYIEGVDLDKKLEKGPQKWDSVVEWGKQLCDVLAYLHSRTPPIIYRDMKPGNVKLKPDGNVVLFDFGTAREYKSQKAGDDTTCLGTRGYAAPEQYGGMGQTDARSDIYCLGATMYHLVTGKIPGGPPRYDMPPIRSICNWLPRTGKDGECVRGLEYIIQKCTQPAPEDRYQSCAELMYDLEHIDQLSAAYMKKQRSKLRTFITTAVLSVAFLVLGIGCNVAQNLETESRYDTAIKEAKTITDPKLAQLKLESAIKISPGDERAWIYLSNLFADDDIITDDEYNDMKTLLTNDSSNLQKDISAYRRFCYRWGMNVYMMYERESQTGATGNSEPKAKEYLREAAGSQQQSNEKAKETEEDSIGYLAGGTDGGSVYEIDYMEAVNYDQARVHYTIAKALYNMIGSYSQLQSNDDMEVKEGTTNSYDMYWSSIKEVVTSIDSLTGSAYISTIKLSVYRNLLNCIKDNYESLKMNITSTDSVTDIDSIARKIKDTAEDVYKHVDENKKASYEKTEENIKSLYYDIEHASNSNK